MRYRKVLFISTKFQKPRQSSIVATSHNIPWGPELPRGQNYPHLTLLKNSTEKAPSEFQLLFLTPFEHVTQNSITKHSVAIDVTST